MNINDAEPVRTGALSLGRAHAVGETRTALQRIIDTDGALPPAVLRITLGVVMLPHALQKTWGLFGGAGFSRTVRAFETQLHLPVALTVLVIFFEQAGSLLLILGLFTRAAAAGIAAVMVGAVVTVHYRNGFFMNWSAKQAGEGYEFHLLVLAMTAALILWGGGRASIDRWLSRERRQH